jgi:transcriptional regulator with XRE-family HTH domain
MNWSNIISELVAAGIKQVEIADACETSQGYISDLLNGKSKQPNWRIGDALLRLHREATSAKAA